MPKLSNGPARLAASKFVAQGPYTLEEVKRLVRLCNAQYDLEKFSLTKSLYKCQDKFSQAELKKLATYSSRNYSEEWMCGCGEWYLHEISISTPDEHLEVFAAASETDGDGFGFLISEIDWKGVSVPLKTELLRIYKSQLLQASKRRERSPKRKKSQN